MVSFGLGIEPWLEAVKGLRCEWLENFQQSLETRYGLVPDPRVLNWPLVDITHVFILALGYLFITYFGMFIMKAFRKPFDIFLVRLIHNFAMVALSCYMFYDLVSSHFLEIKSVAAHPENASAKGFPTPTNASLWCTPYDTTAAGLPIASAIWLFMVSKPIEFMDTFIMVLRKSNRQINFLHMYHHFSIFIVWYINLRYNPGGDAWFAAATNSLVHIVMYSYYFLATLGIPCPWKAFITQFQILQFVSFVAQGIYGVTTECATTRNLMAFNCLYAFSLLALFVHFYFKNYSQRRSTATDAKKTN